VPWRTITWTDAEDYRRYEHFTIVAVQLKSEYNKINNLKKTYTFPNKAPTNTGDCADSYDSVTEVLATKLKSAVEAYDSFLLTLKTDMALAQNLADRYKGSMLRERREFYDDPNDHLFYGH